MVSIAVLTTNLGKNIVTGCFDAEGIVDETAYRFRHIRQTVLSRHLLQERHHVLLEFDRVRGFIFWHTILLELRYRHTIGREMSHYNVVAHHMVALNIDGTGMSCIHWHTGQRAMS